MQHAISQLLKSFNPYCKRQNPKMKLWEVCPLSSTNHKTLKTTAFCRYLLYRHSSHNREFHNVNCRFCGAIHSINWACILLINLLRYISLLISILSSNYDILRTLCPSFSSYNQNLTDVVLQILWCFLRV